MEIVGLLGVNRNETGARRVFRTFLCVRQTDTVRYSCETVASLTELITGNLDA